MNKHLQRPYSALGLGDKIALTVTILLLCSMAWMYYQIILLTP